MLKKIIVLTLIVMSFSIALRYNGISFEQNEEPLIQENQVLEMLVAEAKVEITESSVKVIYYVDKDARAEIEELLLKSNSSAVVQTFSDEIFYFNINENDTYLEFKGVNLADKGEITIKATSLQGEKSLDYLEKYLQVYTENKAEGAIYFKYLKGKLENEEVNYNSERLNKAIEGLGALSLQTLEIHNGITCTALLKDNTLNLNYSICKYDTGTYLIIGTPILDEIY